MAIRVLINEIWVEIKRERVPKIYVLCANKGFW